MSLSGKLILLRAIISVIPMFYMTLFKAPVGVVGEFEKLMRAFLWVMRDSGRHISWISWEEVCKRTQPGGLGLDFLG